MQGPAGPTLQTALIVALDELNDSGQSGIVKFVPKGSQTEVMIEVTSGEADVPQPVHIHAGSCDKLGGVDIPLTNIVNGRSVTLLDISLPTLRQGLNTVNAHKSGAEIGTYVACGNIPAAGTTVTIALAALNDSSQSGAATLIAEGDKTVVALSVTPGAAGVPQPVHIHAGSCDNLGGVNIPLSNVLDGRSVTRVDASLDSLLDGTVAINVHRSGPEIGFYTTCGNIPAVTVKSAPTGLDMPVVLALGELSDSGQNGTVTFTAKGTKTEVTVAISPGAEGVAQPVHIHTGSCADLGGVVYPLTSLAAGQSTTVVPVSLPALFSGTMSVNAHKSGPEIGTYVACGGVPKLSDVMLLAVVRTTDHPVLGTILSDNTGRTLYQFTRDEKNVSNCSGNCAGAWPPLMTVDDPAAGTGVAASLLSTTTRDDGSKQVTYNGKPLYYFANDEKPGDTNGQDRGGAWFVVTANGSPVQTAATVQAAEDATLGTILWDASGRAVYLFMNDEKDVSNCTGGCPRFWPPLITVDAPVAGDGVTGSLLGTITRADDAKQVTYNGKPLYYFANDEKPGDTNGQARGGIWFVVTANGSPVQTAAAVQAATDATLGTILWDASGRVLYVFMKDEKDVSNCGGLCPGFWPPLITVDAPVAGDDVTADLLGSITRADGGKQVTYNGKPLYYFANDEKPGDTNGQDRGGAWFVVTANGSPVQTAATVQAAEDATLGTILWDASGRALYLFMNDEKDVSNCTGGCPRFWPPLITVDAPVAGDGVTAGLLGSITRADGGKQVTYNGKPLYYFANDEKPGDTNGQGRGDAWFVVSPDGAAVQ